MTISKEQRDAYLEACPIFGRENGDFSGDIGFEAGSEECVSCSKTTPKMCSACMEDCGVEVKTEKGERKMQESVEEIAELNEDTPPEDENVQTEETVESPVDVVASLETNDQTENVVVDSPEVDKPLETNTDTKKEKKMKVSKKDAIADCLLNAEVPISRADISKHVEKATGHSSKSIGGHVSNMIGFGIAIGAIQKDEDGNYSLVNK